MATRVSAVPVQTHDDALTICAISLVAGMLANVLHEGLGHAAIALLTGAKSGVLSTVAWSTDVDTRLVAAGGTLANLAAGAAFWIALRSAKGASTRLRFFFLTSLAFNLFAGTGYFFFSGVTNFGDWAVVIAGLQLHWPTSAPRCSSASDWCATSAPRGTSRTDCGNSHSSLTSPRYSCR